MPISAFRYIDFLRKHNVRLFYGKDASEDPVKDWNVNTPKDIVNIPKERESKIHTHKFDLASNLDLKELTDLQVRLLRGYI